MMDVDAPGDDWWVHWLIWNIPGDWKGIREGAPRVKELPYGVLQGMNSWPSGNIGYRGPDPPVNSGKHHYHICLYALSDYLQAPGGVTEEWLELAMRDHVLTRRKIIVTYERKRSVRDDVPVVIM